MLTPIYYLAIGHLTQDLTPTGPRLGGSVCYSTLTARALGYPPGIVTACATEQDLDPLAGIPLHRVPSAVTSTFENLYGPNGRTQYLRQRATPLEPAHVPLEWLRAPIVHLAPLTNEITPEMLTAFPGAFIGLTPQGWLRAWDETGQVRRQDWATAPEFLAAAAATVLSIEDVAGDWACLERWARLARVLVVTEGARGCSVFVRGEGMRQFAAPPQTEVDPTGAGDVFAAAFFVHLYETGDPWAAARLANQIGAIAVTRLGLASAPTPDEASLARVRAELT